MALNVLRAARIALLALASVGLGGLGAASAQALDGNGLRQNSAGQALADPNAGAVDAGPPTPLATPTPKPKRKKRAGPPLPPLQIYPGAQRLGLRGGPPAPDAVQIPAPSVAVQPPAAARRGASDTDPYQPTGIMAGELRLTPYIEESLGYADNPSQANAGAKASVSSQTEIGVGLRSQWARDDLRGELRVGYLDYFKDRSASGPYGSGDLSGRADVTRDLSLDAQARFALSQETVSGFDIAGATISSTSAPLLATYGATFGGTDRFGKFSLALHGSADRTAHQNATLSNGTTAKLSSDNFDDFGLALRGAYEASPEFSPFLEAAYDIRRYDSALDSAGFARNSKGWSASLGASVEITRLLTGEVSAGYSRRAYEDARLGTASGPVASASLVWTPTPLTTVTLRGQAAINETTLAGASSSMARTYSLDVAHRLLRNFLVGANASYTSDTFNGVSQSDSSKSFGVRAEYDIGRDVVLKAAASRLIFVSSAPGANYASDVFTLGLRVQR